MLRTAAQDAWQAELDGEASAARTVLGGVLVPFDVATLTVAARDVSGSAPLFVFTDGDVLLGVVGGAVSLVAADGPRWVKGETVTSLGQLGSVLPATVTPDGWVEGNVYMLGDVVAHDGQAWKSTVDNNVWEPGVAHSVWVVA